MANLLSKKVFTDLFLRLLHKEFISPNPNRQVNSVRQHLGDRKHLNGYFSFILVMEYGIGCFSVVVRQYVFDHGESVAHDQFDCGTRITFDLPQNTDTLLQDLDKCYKRFANRNRRALSEYK